MRSRPKSSPAARQNARGGKLWGLSLAALLFLLARTPSAAGTTPSMTAEVIIAGGVKEYTYILTNDLDAEIDIEGLGIYMPEYGALGVIDSWCSREGWYVSTYVGAEWSAWYCGSRYPWLLPGESVTLQLITSASVPTCYSYTPVGWPANWKWFCADGTGGQAGDSVVPVPVPEPSSLLSLAGGVVGSIGAVVWGRQRCKQRD